jgi:hypothetical protein
VKALQDFYIPNGLHFVVKITYDVSFHHYSRAPTHFRPPLAFKCTKQKLTHATSISGLRLNQTTVAHWMSSCLRTNWIP